MGLSDGDAMERWRGKGRERKKRGAVSTDIELRVTEALSVCMWEKSRLSDTHLLGPLPLGAYKDDAQVRPRIDLVKVALLGLLCRLVHGQVGTPHDTELDLAIDDQREADCVLPAAQEALCAVDGVQRPHAPGYATGAVAAVDGIKHLGVAQGRVHSSLTLSHETLVDEAHDLVLELIRLPALCRRPQVVGILFTDNLVVGKGTPEDGIYDALCAKVAHSHRRLVRLCQARDGRLEHLLRDQRGPPHRLDGDALLVLEVQRRCRCRRG